jgi:CxxC-x17-CxxC domain-containing protein
MADQTLTCQDCGTNFTFTESEQQFFAEKGYVNAPGRCPDCRRVRRETGGTRARGGERTMTDITCSSCGKPAQVPFVPRGDRPVYCSDCHTKQQTAGSSYGSRGGGRRY